MLLKFAKRYDDEIIKAYKKDNPGKVPESAEEFYDYINDYTVAGDKVLKIEDEYVKAGAEHIFNKFNGVDTKNKTTANGMNKITNS